MAHFCTKCGTPANADARFCENCGAPLAAAPTGPSSDTLPRMAQPAGLVSSAAVRPALSRRTLGLIGGAVAVVVIGGGLLAWMLAPEAASQASFTRAIERHFAANPAARDQLVCFNNLPYKTDPIRAEEYDQRTRGWLNTLVRAGVYSAPRTESSGGFFRQTQYVYQLTDVGRASVRENRLCIASGVHVTSVTGFDQVQKNGERSTAIGAATLEPVQEAPWLSKSSERAAIMQRLAGPGMTGRFPLALVDKKWQVDLTPATARSGLNGRNGFPRADGSADGPLAGLFGGMQAPDTAAAKAPRSPGLFDKLSQMFRFGGHPLVGKWTDESGIVSFEFTADSMVTSGVSIPATFQVKGDDVFVTPSNGGGQSLIVKMRDADHAALDMGMMSVMLRRVR